MSKLLAFFIAAMVFGCGALPEDEPIASEELALPVQASAPCIRVTCDQATCNGSLTVSQAVPANTGHVEIWSASQWGASYVNHLPSTTITQSPGSVVTVTPMTNFRRDEFLCLLTSVVVRNSAGNIINRQSQPITNAGELALQPLSVTATVSP